MQKLFQKDGTSNITSNRLTILRSKKGFGQIGRYEKQLMYFLRKLGSYYFQDCKNKNYFESDIEEELSWGWI